MARHTMTAVTRSIARAGVFAAAVIGFASPALSASCSDPSAFAGWLQGFKKQAIAQGIPPGVVSSALDGLSYDPATIAKDRGQSVFAQTFLQFSGRMVSANRIQMGTALLKKYADTFRKIEQQYGVPGPVLVGFWGLETDFGKVMGNMQTLRSLATLAFDCRRPDEFQEQLLDALWPGANVTDNALAQAVSELRDALGDDAGSPQYIKTVARRGYRQRRASPRRRLRRRRARTGRPGSATATRARARVPRPR